MQKNLREAFLKSNLLPEASLAFDVWRSVVLQEKRAARFKLWAFSFIGLVSFAGLLPIFKTLSSDLSRSGFYEYFSLIFSDSGSVIHFWKEFSLSLLESLPVISAILSLILIFTLFLSLKYALKQTGGHLSLSF